MLKSSWVVLVGIIPNEPDQDKTRRWDYTSDEYAADLETIKNNKGSHLGNGSPAETIFNQKRKEAHQYAMNMESPNEFNWVRVIWIWY